eukprot:TRINITY_DN1381_c0_g1_i1.p1 TRINITY_DN1381_c0_g1~~TRINITY_DN1381_c0_g1_i1.p1  ORF type:complete len:806 (-),score=111.96 TRINITY_DN1381_c0_g1_i1:970-3264(-)
MRRPSEGLSLGRPAPGLSPPSKDVSLVFRTFGIIALLLGGYFLGRPVYWQLEDGFRELVESWHVASHPDGEALHAALHTEGHDTDSVHPEDAKTTASAVDQDPIAEPLPQGDQNPIVNLASMNIKAADAVEGSAKTAGPFDEESKTLNPEESSEGNSFQAADDGGNKGADYMAALPDKGLVPLGVTEIMKAIEALPPGVRRIVHEGEPVSPLLFGKLWDKPPPDTIMPPIKEFKLRKEMIDARAVNNVVVLTFANHAFLEFVTNWVRHLTDAGVENILVGAMDQEILEALFYLGIPTFDLEANLPPGDAGWGSPMFHKMGREKVTLVNVFLAMGYEVLICDTDMVWLENPLPYFARFPEVDVFTSSDDLVGFAKGDGLEPWNQAWGAFNIGMLFFRPTDAAKRMAAAWSTLLEGNNQMWDQNGFNDILRKKMGPTVDESENSNQVFYSMDGTLKTGILPVSMFCSGHTYYVQRKAEKLGLPLFAVHTTFQFAGTEGKRHRLRESKMFHDPPEYYDSPGGFLAFEPKIPEELLRPPTFDLISHFKLVNYQLKQIRSAMALSVILKRTLVMPPLWCHYDRMWYPHPGILQGTQTSQPFLCPMDHVFELQHYLRDMPEAEFGPKILFKEYSFLENPRTPPEVKNSRQVVELCDSGSAACPEFGVVAPNKPIRLPRRASQTQVLEVLGAYTTVKVLDFDNMADAFGEWGDKELEKRFRWRISHTLGAWCCITPPAGSPGHIWYDFFADEKTGWEPKPPRPGQDHPAFV